MLLPRVLAAAGRSRPRRSTCTRGPTSRPFRSFCWCGLRLARRTATRESTSRIRRADLLSADAAGLAGGRGRSPRTRQARCPAFTGCRLQEAPSPGFCPQRGGDGRPLFRRARVSTAPPCQTDNLTYWLLCLAPQASASAPSRSSRFEISPIPCHAVAGPQVPALRAWQPIVPSPPPERHACRGRRTCGALLRSCR